MEKLFLGVSYDKHHKLQTGSGPLLELNNNQIQTFSQLTMDSKPHLPNNR